MPVWLGLDYGARRVGIAVSDPTGSLAFALGTHVAGRDASLVEHLAGLIRTRQVTGIVVGLPLTADGREGAMAEQARAFAGRLQAALQLPVVLYDERFSSRTARGFLRPARPRRKRKEDVDALAAEIILQDFLDAQAGPGDGPGRSEEPEL